METVKRPEGIRAPGFNSLTEGEGFIFMWQYRMLGGFETALMEAIGKADEGNLMRLSLGFPHEVDAFKRFSREEGWWGRVEKTALSYETEE